MRPQSLPVKLICLGAAGPRTARVDRRPVSELSGITWPSVKVYLGPANRR